MESLTYSHRTHVGRLRKMNQDSLAVLSQADLHGLADALLVVADGMGGRAGGEIASRVTVETVPKVVREVLSENNHADSATRMRDAVHEALLSANEAVYGQAKANPELRGMGTTCVSVLVAGDQAVVGNIGDSRVYILRDGGFRALTHDHSLVAQHLQSGELTEEEAKASRYRNIITRAIGIAEAVEPDVESVRLRAGDTLLLCSDGLTNMLKDTEIARILARGDDLEATCDNLITSANAAGGADNITVVVTRYGQFVPVEIEESDEEEPEAYPTRDAYARPARRSFFRYLQIPLLFAVVAAAWVTLSRYELHTQPPYLRPRKPDAGPARSLTVVPRVDFTRLEYLEPESLPLKQQIKGSALAVSENGVATVIDSEKGRAWQVWTEGKLPFKYFARPGRESGGEGVAVDPDGNRYFVSPTDNTIRKINGKGIQIKTIGKGDLSRPTQIGIHPQGHIYVIDDGFLKIIRVKPQTGIGADSGGPR